jgi:hypothetical protein
MARVVLVLILVGSLTRSFAQFKNIVLDTQSEGDYMCEPSIAINPRNPLNIVAASVLNNIYVTKDGGLTWQKKEVESPFGVYGDPALIANSKGDFYFFHLSDPTHGKGGYETEKLDRIVVQFSSDGGESWSEGESIGLNHPKDQDKQWPAIDAKGNIYLAWTEFDTYGSTDPNCQSNILLSSSRNGKKWSTPMSLSQTPGNCLDDDQTVMGGMPAVTFDGKIFVAWANQNKIFLDRSYDGGSMWLTNDIAIANQEGGWDMKIEGHDRANGLPIIMTDKSKTSIYKGSLYVLWADQGAGPNDTDIWLIRSSNFGDNWTAPVRVNNDESTTHQYLPWLTVDPVTGYLYVVYYDRRNYEDNQTDVYLAYSINGGTSFENVKISEAPFVPSEESFFGDYTNISAHNGVITPIWTRMDNGKTSIVTTVIKQEELMPKK